MNDLVLPREELDAIAKMPVKANRGKASTDMVLKYFRTVFPNLEDVSGRPRSMDLYDYMMNLRIEVKNEENMNNHKFNRKFEDDIKHNCGTLTFIFINTKPCDMKEVLYINDIVFINGYILTQGKLQEVKEYVKNRNEYSDMLSKIRETIGVSLMFKVCDIVKQIKEDTTELISCVHDNKSLVSRNDDKSNSEDEISIDDIEITTDHSTAITEITSESIAEESKPTSIDLSNPLNDNIEMIVKTFIRGEMEKCEMDKKYNDIRERIDEYILDHYQDVYYDRMTKTKLKSDLKLNEGGMNGNEIAIEVMKEYDKNVIVDARHHDKRDGKSSCVLRFTPKILASIKPLMMKMNVTVNEETDRIGDDCSPEDKFLAANKDKNKDEVFYAIMEAYLEDYDKLNSGHMIRRDFQETVNSKLSKINSSAKKISQSTIEAYIISAGVKRVTSDGKACYTNLCKTKINGTARNGAPKRDAIDRFIESLSDKDILGMIHDIDLEITLTNEPREVRRIGDGLSKPDNVGKLLSIHKKFFNTVNNLADGRSCCTIDEKIINLGEQLSYIRDRYPVFHSCILKYCYGQSTTDEKENLIYSIDYCCEHRINFTNFYIYVVNTRDANHVPLYSYLLSCKRGKGRDDVSAEIKERLNVMDSDVKWLIKINRRIIEGYGLHKPLKNEDGPLCIEF